MIKKNFAQFEASQADHKVTSASAVKYGGVVESLALATFGNYIGAEVTLPELKTALTAQLGGFVFTSPEEIAGVEDWTNESRLYTDCQRCEARWTQA